MRARVSTAALLGFAVAACVVSPREVFALSESWDGGVAGGAGGIVVYVDDDAPPGGDGLTWDTAYRYLQDALTFANNWQNDVNEIRVAQGTYWPDESAAHPEGTGNPNAGFIFLLDYMVAGGYAGVIGPDPDARDIETFQTIFSGDLQGDDEPGFVNDEDNSLKVVSYAGTIDGCTIRSGNMGVYTTNHLVVTSCRFELNFWAVNSDSIVEVTSCEFDLNDRAINANLGVVWIHDSEFTNQSGRAINVSEAGLYITDSLFAFNAGGAFSTFDKGGVNISNCHFVGNSAALGGAAYFGSHANGGPFLNCTFEGNSAEKGGVVYTRGDELDQNDPRFINCTFLNNSASVAGGVMYSIWSDPKFTNCTLAGNSAPNTAGIYTAGSSTLKVRNSIIKLNSGAPLGGPGARTVLYSNISGGHEGAGNINANPKFKDLANGDLRLKSSSPCIDAGKNNAVPDDVDTDLAGNPRFVNAPGTPNSGSGTPPIVDMGAYEFQP